MIVNTKPETDQLEIDAVGAVIQSGWMGRGRQCEEFEKEFSDYISPKGEHYYCLFTNCATNALKMAYRIAEEMGVKKLFIPVNTYCATYSALTETNIKHSSYYPDEKAHSKDMRVNLHFGGVKDETPCLIEDSAHRIEPQDKLVGKMRCYSLHPNKNATSGGGGFFVTDNERIYKKAKLWIEDGLVRTEFGRFDYTVEETAGGYEGFDINAAIGRVQLRKLPEFNRKRQLLVDRYNEAFNTKWTGLHIFPLYLKDYDEVKKAIVGLEKQGISCKSHYPGSNVMSLPLYPSLTFKQQDEVIRKVNAYLHPTE